jgi:cupin fold WbuC family metalloprotein
MQFINNKLLNKISSQAKENPRLRMNHNFHSSPKEDIQRMLNAIEPDSYIPAHMHPDKIEVYLVLRGKLKIFFYDDDGKVIETRILSPETGEYGVDIPMGVWHNFVVLESGTVVYEYKQGPYDPNNGFVLAPWIPAPEDKKAVNQYMKKLREY